MVWTRWALLAACSERTATTPDGGTPSTDVPATEHTGLPSGDTGATSVGHTGASTTDTAEGFDCSQVPSAPVAFRKLAWAPTAEDYTISADADMITVTGGLLKRTPFGGPSVNVAPGFGDVRGTRFLPDGRLALAHPEDGSVWVADLSTGGHTVAAGNLTTPNGIAIHPDGLIYVATAGRIVRIDPDTHVTETVADMPRNSFDGLTFSPDYTRLYFNEELGQVNWVDLAPDGTPSAPQGPLRIPVTPLAGFGILDGMAMDACGNLYVNEMNGKVWRVRPNGTMEVLADITGLAIIPALNFGLPDRDGWHLDKLYVLDFTGALWEVDAGVPGKWEPHMPR